MNEKLEGLIEETNRKLGVVIALLANPVSSQEGKQSLKDQIRVLNQYGLVTSEIAAILNKKPNHVSKELTALRKQNDGQ